jgi:hypothetical protein
MKKLSIVLMLLISVSVKSQKVLERWLDSNQHIYVMTTLDTLARGEKDCLVGGMIYNQDSISIYCLYLAIFSSYKIDPLSVVHIEILLENGEIFAMEDSSDKTNLIRENSFAITDYITIDELKKLENNPVFMIRVLTKNDRFIIKTSEPFANTLCKLSKLLLETNVYEELHSVTYDEEDLKVVVYP